MRATVLGLFVAAASLSSCGSVAQRQNMEQATGGSHASGKFVGPKANAGRVTHSVVNGRDVLELSADFVTPDAPDPHWMVVDAHGGTHLLERLMVKGDILRSRIEVPSHVPDIASVRIWCAWAETVLGEASFDRSIALAGRMDGGR